MKLVTYLIELGSPIDPIDDTETTPLILASSAGHSEIVSLLIQKGANLNQQSSNGHSALQYAASKGWIPVSILGVTEKRFAFIQVKFGYLMRRDSYIRPITNLF